MQIALREFILRFFKRAFLKRNPNYIELLLIKVVDAFFKTKADQQRVFLSDGKKCKRVQIISPSDVEYNEYRKFMWGDYWAQYELTKAIGRLGFVVSNIEPDIVVNLFGGKVKLPDCPKKILWVYSHPESVDTELLSAYDEIYCLSSTFTHRIQEMGFDAEWAPGASSKSPLPLPIKYDVVFVGNPKNGKRKIITDLGEVDYDLKVFGKAWESIISPKYIGGDYFDYMGLNCLYSQSKISLCDYTEEMANDGFVSVRVFDIIAGGGFCISEKNSDLDKLFGETVPQYSTADELRGLVKYYLENEDKRIQLKEKAFDLVKKYTWDYRAKQLLRRENSEY